MGFKASPSAWICVWIWIVSQMSSWINMAIYLQLQLDFHSLPSLLQESVISSCCFKWAWNSSDNVLIKQTNKQTLLVKKKDSSPHILLHVHCDIKKTLMSPDHRVTLQNEGGDYHNAADYWSLLRSTSCSLLFDAKEVVYFKHKSIFPFRVNIITSLLAQRLVIVDRLPPLKMASNTCSKTTCVCACGLNSVS